MHRSVRLLLDIFFAILGVGLLVYADVTTNRALRLTAIVVIALAAVVALVLAMRRDHED